MARRTSALDSIIRLAENPEFGDDEMYPHDEPDGDEGMPFGDDDGDELDDMAMKGRRVSGPRTKLSASLDARLSNMQRGQAMLAKSINVLARLEKARQLSKHDDLGGGMGDDMGGAGYEEDEDPMAIPPEGEDEDQLDLAAGPQLRATGEGTNLTVRKAQLRKAAAILRKSGYTIGKVSKDDAASSFGEKDSNVPGNRPFDTEDVGETDTVIQDGPGGGPGPVSKGRGNTSAFNTAVNKAVDARLAAAGVGAIPGKLMKATAPAPGAQGFETKLDNAGGGENLDQLFDGLKGRSFGEINRLRVELGDLSAGMI